MIAGGHAPNALPGSATANVNCRIMPGHSAEEIRKKLVAVVNDPAVAVRYKDDGGSLHDNADDRLPMKPPPVRGDVSGPLKKIVDEMWPGTPIVPEMESGASDSIFTTTAGMPSYGISGMGIGEGDDRAHGRDERLGIASFYQGVEFTRRLVKAIGEE
jgi:acetylornithine deacetylase/succinyl-diaminopimelate desuccinylase-like protein